jgi:hypothetical protein
MLGVLVAVLHLDRVACLLRLARPRQVSLVVLLGIAGTVLLPTRGLLSRGTDPSA